MKRKNIAAMVTSIALVGAVAVGGTLALLTQPSNTVTNVFTVGAGYVASDIVLDEAPVSQVTTGTVNYGGYKATEGERTKGNNYDNLVAGTTLDKDPTFRMTTTATSPKSWFVAKVEGVTDNAGKLTVSGVETGNGWYAVSVKEGVYTYTPVTAGSQIQDDTYYIYDTAISKGEETDPLFTQLSVVSADAKPANIVVSGWAVDASVSSDFATSRDAVMAAVGLK